MPIDIKDIQGLESEYGQLSNVPDDNQTLLEIRANIRPDRVEEVERPEDKSGYALVSQVDYDRLHKLIRSSHIPQAHIAKSIGLSYDRYYRKRNRLDPFTWDELARVAVFFGCYTKDLVIDKRRVRKYRLKLEASSNVFGYLNINRKTGVKSISTYGNTEDYQTIFTENELEAMDTTGFVKVEVI